MKNTTARILITLVVIIGLYRLIRLYGVVYGLLLSFGLVLFFTLFAFGLDRFYKWRSNRLVRSILLGETLVASGLVSESVSDETPAIIVRGTGNYYRVHVADSRGSQVVRSVTPELTHHANVHDMKLYIKMHTDQGVVHFAPRRGFLVATQPDYAQEVLIEMLSNGIPPQG